MSTVDEFMEHLMTESHLSDYERLCLMWSRAEQEERELSAAEARIKVLSEALRFYADESIYKKGVIVDGKFIRGESPVSYDRGQQAQTVLAHLAQSQEEK